MTNLLEIRVPDVGNVAEIDVVEVLIQPGDIVALEQTVATLETDKASMDLPSSVSGTIQQVHIKPGDKVSEGTLIAIVLANEGEKSIPEPISTVAIVVETPAIQQDTKPAELSVQSEPTPKQALTTLQPSDSRAIKAHASPSVRLFARELGVNVSKINMGSGRKGRILKDDIKNFVKQALTEGITATSTGIPSIPAVDFSPFGDTEILKLSKIKRLTGQNLTRVWLNLPLVTYHEEVDITEMEAFRNTLNGEKQKGELKITGLMFIIKALVAAMQQFPNFNASLSADGESLILKKYFNIGIAVDTPNGLVVPVLRNVNNKNINELAIELSEKSEKARLGKLLPNDMQGGCMTISSLGGIGGTAFTPIVNAPEVAILGVTRAKMQPVWNGNEFLPRLMLPLDLTYDHRVIDGAEGARFMATVKQNLSDIRRLLL
jgi:pyruvate dehydrogenase E2 component (dihydrolipoamide acetyltransferase)